MTARRPQLKTIREQRSLTVSELAKQAAVSRQTIYAIEDGSFVPNTLVSLRLARILGVSVEDLFPLDETPPDTVEAELLSTRRESSDGTQLVRLYESEGRRIALPVETAFHYLPLADGVTGGKLGRKVQVAANRRSTAKILLAGCDPALSLLSELARSHGIEIVPIPVSSRKALVWLSKGLVHMAGTHLPDHESGDYNAGAIRGSFPKGGVQAMTFAHWESGLITKAGNPKAIRSIADLASREVSIVNREKGSGSRVVLDAELKGAGIPVSKIKGYDREVYGHLSAAICVASGWADCCLAARSAARCYGLGFVPLQTARFDLVFPENFLKSKAGQALAGMLNQAEMRQKLAHLAGYETRQTGKLIY